MATDDTRDTHTDYRVGASKIPYRGPARLDDHGRKKHVVIGVTLFVIVGVVAVIFAWLGSVH